MTPTIRRARADECDSLTALCLRSKAHWGYDAAFMAACVEELTVHPDRIAANEFWLAERPEQDGPVTVGLYEAVPEPDRSFDIFLFFVDPPAIGAGIGGALWRHMEARARARGVTRIAVEADPQASPFYQHMGCIVTGEVPSRSIPGRTLPSLEKKLGSM